MKMLKTVMLLCITVIAFLSCQEDATPIPEPPSKILIIKHPRIILRPVVATPVQGG